ncbi:MAG: BlaI/MecI/CopY family transcriptional regulator [bacterium]|nr:BlaI/MecI/CopY family transcriptional regulator [bacterium]
MTRRGYGLGELELAVLKALWDGPERTVQDVAEELGKERGCARTTVLTVMQRLHVKGLLKRRKVGGIFHYRTSEGRGAVVSRLIGQFVEKVLDGSAAPFLAYLADAKDLTDDEMGELRTIVESMERDDEGE